MEKYLISLDCETTGIDFVHGAMPFLVTTCDSAGQIRWFEWDVDPLTRQPHVPPEDVEDIVELIDTADLIYLHNAKFDARALAAIGIDLPWSKVRDTLIASHLLATNHPHNLTWLCIEYLGVDIEPYELHVKEITQTCRAIAKKDFPTWMLADEGVSGMPSVKGSSKREEDRPWKNDMWLERALIKQWKADGTSFRKDDPWIGDACSRYANADSEHTLPLGLELERLIRERGYWKIYEHRLHLPRIACDMECYGVTAIGEYTEKTISEFEEYVAEAEAALVDIAAGYGHNLELAEGAAINDNMRDFFYGAMWQKCQQCGYTKRIKHWNGTPPASPVRRLLDGYHTNNEVCPKCLKRKRDPAIVSMIVGQRDNLKLPIINGKTGNASLDKDAIQDYLTTLDEGPALDFVEILSDKRNHGTALTYMHAYRRFWVPVLNAPGYYRIHASLNPCATDHLRWASNSPNMQNVSGETKEISNRACFGPLPDREWWRMDFRSIERRIPAYESGELKMIEVFEHPDQPPHWGNLYNLTASVLYPEEYWPCAETEGLFRKEYPRLYKQAKFFDLAKQYGCGRAKGDLLSRVRNSFDSVDSEFPLLTKLQAHYLAQAERIGWVETLPDRTVDPDRGYPILASRTEDGRVLSTTPFSYHTSGTACWIKNQALIKCSEKLGTWRREGFDAYIALEVHDELLFDLPRGSTMEENLPRALILKRLMESCGEQLIPCIPSPVSVDYYIDSWAEGVTVC